MAQKFNLVIDQGSDFSQTINISVPSNLSDHTIEAQMRKTYSSNTVYTFTANVASNTSIELNMSKSITKTIEPGRYKYDAEATDSANTTTRVIEGIVTVTPNMTR